MVITQKGQEFHPSNITIKRGDIVEIYNNDGNFLHHAYIAQSNFHYDSGDQLPGTRSDIAMIKSGVFTVLCGIHPQMHLRVVVH
ncbi:MAG: methylamine utilization protein [Hyphomicrobiales bacterium]|nr:methylamine utilization protein [Hyphomicrobiales bacterium]